MPASPDPSAHPPARRLKVVGTSGSGKTTLARAAAARLGVPHLELDSIHHLAGWRQASPEEFRGALDAFLASAPDGWVIDGNYRSRAPGLDALADLVVWVDPPRPVVTAQVLRRTVVRGITRRELWNGNREPLSGLVRRRPEDNIVLWSWRTFDGNRARYAAEADAGWVRLRSRREARAWLASLG